MLARMRALLRIHPRTYPSPGEPKMPSGSTMAPLPVPGFRNLTHRSMNRISGGCDLLNGVALLPAVGGLVVVPYVAEIVLFKNARFRHWDLRSEGNPQHWKKRVMS